MKKEIEYERQFEKEENAAIRLQTFQRKIKAKKLLEIMKSEKEKKATAVIKLQTLQRKRKAKKLLEHNEK